MNMKEKFRYKFIWLPEFIYPFQVDTQTNKILRGNEKQKDYTYYYEEVMDYKLKRRILEIAQTVELHN